VTFEKARELLKVQADFGGFYNANGAKLILAEVTREHGQAAVDRLIRELDLERIFGFAPGTEFDGGLSAGRRR
jgi:hypothetical protein